MAERQNLLVICPSTVSPFVRSDVEILRQRYETELWGVNMFRFPRKIRLLFRFLRYLVHPSPSLVLLFFSVPTYAPLVALLTRMFGKKLVIITGGYDTTYVPSIDWGEMRSFWKRLAQRFTLALTHRVLAFSDFSRNDVLKYGRPKHIQTLYFGVDTVAFSPSGPKEAMVMTVCFHINASTLIQKGLATLLACAKNIPQASFVLVGRTSDEDEIVSAKRNAPRNVKFLDQFVPPEELLAHYRRAAVYAQLSAHEGFGIANAEAMACECVPVVTGGTALPEVVGDTGFVVEFGNIEETTNAIRSALEKPDLGKKARMRIQERFPVSRRQTALLQVLASALEDR